MKLGEIKTGEIFCIEGKKSYPKLKLDIGYVDMRDEIRNKREIRFDCDLLSQKEVEKEFAKYGMEINDIETLKKHLIKNLMNNGNRIKLSNFNYKINYEFICEDCQKDFYKRGWIDVKTYSVKMG